MSSFEPSRRRFLDLVATGTVVYCGVGLGCSSASPGAALGTVDAGNIKDLPVGTLRAVGSEAVAIGRDAGGVYAMSLTCTHQGCNIASQGTVSTSGVVCHCHGARFTADGAVVQGPANEPLPHFEVSIDGSGQLGIHGDTEVDATKRTAVG